MDDTKTAPVCEKCHQRCHNIAVAYLGERLLPVSEEDQAAAVDATFRKFMIEAPEEDVSRVMKDLRGPTTAICPF